MTAITRSPRGAGPPPSRAKRGARRPPREVRDRRTGSEEPRESTEAGRRAKDRGEKTLEGNEVGRASLACPATRSRSEARHERAAGSLLPWSFSLPSGGPVRAALRHERPAGCFSSQEHFLQAPQAAALRHGPLPSRGPVRAALRHERPAGCFSSQEHFLPAPQAAALRHGPLPSRGPVRAALRHERPAGCFSSLELLLSAPAAGEDRRDPRAPVPWGTNEKGPPPREGRARERRGALDQAGTIAGTFASPRSASGTKGRCVWPT